MHDYWSDPDWVESYLEMKEVERQYNTGEISKEEADKQLEKLYGEELYGEEEE